MRKIVVKIGSSIITPSGKLDSAMISKIVKDIIAVEKKGFKVILVSSGAISCGLIKTEYEKRPQDTYVLMALASLGQINLMEIYKKNFNKNKKFCAQILLTWDDFDIRKRFINARHTIDKLLNLGAIPIINENDAISYEEIKFGDNDHLSALVGDMIGAELLIILSDVDGLMDDNNSIIREVPQIDDDIYKLVRKGKKMYTTGGMYTKLDAAKIAVTAGIKTVIANGRTKNVISKIIDREKIGTVFLPSKKIDNARKRWIAFSKIIKGKVYVDDGAKEVLVNGGRNLLNVGIMKVEGNFKRDDAVEIVDKSENMLGCGLINYSYEELKEAKGKKLDKEVIKWDNFVKVSDKRGEIKSYED